MERLIQRVFFEMPTPVAVLKGADSASILANPAFEALVGEDAWVRSLGDLQPFLDHVLETGNTCHIENRPVAVAEGNSTRYLSYTFTHMPAQGDEPQGILVTALDTTERVEARVQMQDLLMVGLDPKRLETGDGGTSVVLLDSTGAVLHMNEAERRSLGPPDNEGAPIYTHRDGTPFEEADLPGARALRGCVTVTDVVRVYPGGHERQILTSTGIPIWGPDGHVTMAIIVSRDVTSHYKYRRERAAERAKLNAILQQIPVGVVVIDPATGAVILQNGMATELLSVPQSDGGAQSVLALIQGASPTGQGPVSQALMGQTIVGYEMEVVDVEGHSRLLRVSSAPIHDEWGRIIAAVCVFGDLTARRQEEREREALVRLHEHEMHDMLESKDRFLSLASHELKTPLTILMANLQLFTMAWESLSREQRVNMTESLTTQCRKLNRLVSDLLDISRLTTGHLSVSKELVDIGSLLRSVVEDQARASRSHTLVFDDQAFCPIRADAARLEQVLSNLIANATRYSPPESVVRIGMDVAEGQVTVWVSDDGVGISSDDLPHVFDMYYRSEAVRTDKPAGLGLGLYVAREVVLLHGGDIQVHSQVGVGSTFTITLPMK